MDTYSILVLLMLPPLLAIPLFSLRTALIVYVVGSLIFPYFHVGGLFIRFELIYALWLIIVLAVTRVMTRTPLRVHETVLLYSMYLLIVITSSIIPLGQVPAQMLDSLVVLYGLFRPLLVLLVFANASMDASFMTSIMRIFLAVSVGINLFTVAQFLGLEAATAITKQFYLSPAGSEPFELLIAIFGRLARPMSVFESPVYNANYTLVVILVCFTLLQTERNMWLRGCLYLAGILAAIAGLMTSSTTFLLGIMVLLGIAIWTNLRFPRRVVSLATAVVIGGSLVFCIFRSSPALQDLARGRLAYQAQRITGLDLFASRYAPESGILSETYSAILERPLIGNGVVQREGAFIGDSTYVATLYMGGLIGLAIYLFVFYRVLKLSSSTKGLPGTFGLLNSLVFQMTLVLLATGLAAPTFHMRRVSEFYWALVGMSVNRGLKGGLGNDQSGKSPAENPLDAPDQQLRAGGSRDGCR